MLLRRVAMKMLLLEGVLKNKWKSSARDLEPDGCVTGRWREVWDPLTSKDLLTWDSHPRSGFEQSEVFNNRLLANYKVSHHLSPPREDHLANFFGSMEKSLATPEQSHSSVFMTPSSSVSKPSYRPPRSLVLTPLPWSLLSPAATPKGTCMDLPPSPPENLDILSELYMRGLPHVSQQILAHLAPADLCRWVDQFEYTAILMYRGLVAAMGLYQYSNLKEKLYYLFYSCIISGLYKYAERGTSKFPPTHIWWRRSLPIVGSAKRVQKTLKKCTKQVQ